MSTVGQLMLCCQCESDVQEIVDKLSAEVEVKCFGTLEHYLGIQIERTENGGFLPSQRTKILNLAKALSLEDIKRASFPLDPSYLKLEDGVPLKDNCLYRETIGKLLYLAQLTRPDALDGASQKGRGEFTVCCPEKKSYWDIVRQAMKFQRGDSLYNFEPHFPEKLWIEERTFCYTFPFHIVFDKTLKIKQAGVNIQKFVPRLQTIGTRLDKYFTIVHPQVTFTIFSIRRFINSQFVLKVRRDKLPKSWNQRPLLKLRGQMVWMEGLQCMLYLCSPKLRSLVELEEQQMHLSDIAQHDTTRDLILFNQQRLAEIELSNQLERKKEELRILSKNLDAEKKKSEALLYSMLPKHVANQLKEGHKVEAGDFSSCTILFSDVVTFTNICSVCEPIQIVKMLNSMYSKFDRLTSVHGVYKVETIGDAYMVVGGVPVPIPSHAERVANFALGMRIAAREVMNPITQKPIQIRIGIHSGPVLAGVVGDKMPRYCLFGDTVNTASRMESHGLPDKIHISPTAFRALQHQGFDIAERGEIEVKGKGKMTTYFLRQNLCASENEIMGHMEDNLGNTDDDDALRNDGGNNVVAMKYADCQELVPSTEVEYGPDIQGILSVVPVDAMVTASTSLGTY
ncbi:guanylate cyclase soluble subunit beta-2-like [Heteronotia binoei]|uniref:guanylate cyclase soluble subunit beta-2-like n=1 Tax=Heteronotia binoei TaxID=13085 RepID=UPI00292FBCF3|nr:guanylate cyclase soluble subunit beta-2-like [Heteronotia binoei]